MGGGPPPADARPVASFNPSSHARFTFTDPGPARLRPYIHPFPAIGRNRPRRRRENWRLVRRPRRRSRRRPMTESPLDIRLKRIYEPADASDGRRVLVERLWPRGVTKEAAALDRWVKELAPSPELRTWFGHAP